MQILVTGAAGFIGSHLCDRLIDLGHEVLGVDDLSTGSLDNLRQLEGASRFSFLHRDVCEPFGMGFHAERVYHLACPASPAAYQRDPIRTAKTCFMGTLHALEYAVRCRAQLLLASTSEVYGDPAEHPQRESYRGNVNPIGPRACYDEGKRIAETLQHDFVRQHFLSYDGTPTGFFAKTARIFNTYGPRMALDDGRVVSNFVVQALSGEDVTVYGDGKQTRSFCYVADTVEGLIKLLEGRDRGPCNIGNPHEVTVGQLANLVVELTKSGSAVVHRPLPVDDPTRRRPDITIAAQVLGWEPKVPLAEGLGRTVEDFRRRLRATAAA